MSLADVVDLLRCPVCPPESDAALALRSGPDSPATVGCASGHRFDLARQGYLNLLGGPAPRHADSAAMVAARDRVLSGAASAYGAVLSAVADAAAQTQEMRRPDWRVLDCGAGTGHYLAAALTTAAGGAADHSRRGIALDVSTHAARRAARWPLAVGAVVADAWRPLPVRSGVVDVVLSVFAPRRPDEFARVLRPGGALVVAHPAPDHLTELRGRLDLIGQQPDKAERLEAALAGQFTRTAATTVRTRDRWSAGTIADVVGMGPNAFHGGPSAGVQELDDTWVTVAVQVSSWGALS